MPTEIELKLLIDKKNIAALRESLKQYANGVKAQRRHLLSYYFDTPTSEFWAKKMALRVRQVDGKWVQTLKGDGGVNAGIHQRAEWETAVDDNHPDFARLAAAFPDDRVLQRLIKKLPTEDNIAAIFCTDFHREALTLPLPDGGEVEIAIDEGNVLVGKKQTPISELEVELKSGNPVAVFDFGRRLLADVPLAIGIVSKAERGYALVCREKLSVPQRALSVEFEPSTTVDDAFTTIFTECLGHLLGNVEGVVSGRDPEYLHQLRVAVRRLRGALTVFGDVAPKAVLAGISNELREAGQTLGEARNWDVLLHETIPDYEKSEGVTITAELASQLQRDAQRVKANARRLVRSRQFTDLLLAIGACVVGRAWRQNATESTLNALSDSVGVFAVYAIQKRRRQLKKRVAAIEADDLETLHAIRIAAKKLRYSVQFFASLFPAKHVEPYANALAEIQNLLGRTNDMATASKLLAGVAARSPELSDEVTAMNAWLQAQLHRDQRLFTKTWSRFIKLRPVTKNML
ncbi:MAG: CHAD domain-containing protein [Pseudomonadota bacterium]